jgi:hypothetical protein
VVAAERAMRAIEELRRGLSPRLEALGVVINRFRPQSKEHAYRAHELQELFKENLMAVQIEERATIQQAQGAAIPIHTWPGDHAAELAKIFDEILSYAMASFQQPVDKKRIKVDKKMTRISKIMRGQDLDAVLKLESLEETPAPVNELPTQPAEPVDPKSLCAFEQLEALASLSFEEKKPE